MTRTGIPFKPDYSATRARAAALVPRGAAAALIAKATSRDVGDFIARDFGNDRDLGLMFRAVSEPAALTAGNWAEVFAMPGVPDFVGGIGPASAASALLRTAGGQYRFGAGVAGIPVPTLLADATAASFVGEGPIPVASLAVGETMLVERALKCICVFSREAVEVGVPNLIETTRIALSANIGLAADLAMFDANPGTSVRPGGLRAGIGATAGQSANEDTNQAMIEDLRLIAGTLAPISGNGAIVLVASPAQAWRLKLVPNLPFEVLMSSSIAAGDVIGIALDALVVGFDPVPRYEVTKDGTVHLDTTPTAISTAGSPNVVSAKVIDLFSTDSLGLKVSLGVSWGLRNAGGLCWLTSVVW